MAVEVFTIGHSTHALSNFTELLQRHGIACVADVRANPGSRRMPHFNRDALAGALPEHGIAYQHHRQLGGRRRPHRESLNTGWENESFRAYADYMESREFAQALQELEETAAAKRTVVMCAEAVWWRCHRRLVSDALVVRGHQVWHIAADGKRSEHQLTSFALVEGGRLTYPAAQTAMEERPAAEPPAS